MRPLAILLTTLLLTPIVWGQQHDHRTMERGDLLFFEDTAGMGSAVRESTGNYTHVALVETVGDTLWIIDATPRHGVSRHPMSLETSNSTIYRLTISFDTIAVLARARNLIGQPYDDAFLPDNGKIYCSELIYEVFLDSVGNHLFKSNPMNWRSKDGNLPEYWQNHFKALDMPVPEGVPGTNPTDLSRSPLLRKL